MGNISEKRLRGKLELREFKLSALLDVTRAINSKSSEDELLEHYSKALQTHLGIGRLVIYSVDLGRSFWRLLIANGVSSEVPETQPIEFFNKLNSGGISLAGVEGLNNHSFDIVIPVYKDDVVIAFVLAGDKEEDAPGMSPVVKHLNFIQTLTNILVVALRNRELVEENLRQAGVRKELELAGEMQAMLLPKVWPKDSKIDVSGYYQPHQQIGGDYYDCFLTGVDQVVMCMADVSGKGVGAAILMSNFQANVRAIFNSGSKPLIEKVQELNTRVMDSAQGEKFITFFVAVYDKKSNSLEYVNCGHNPPLWIDAQGHSLLLELGAVGLGMFKELPTIVSGNVEVLSGSTLICYTDGLVEQENEKSEEFGMTRLEEIVRQGEGLTIDAMHSTMVKSLKDFRGSTPPLDDTALLSCRFR
ncbi:MAG: SpoIIE family protein phosphatase [Bacteroidetes bacterium]|nr:SpoIIE family protein phosphatase [Bacteroidota bacterium]